MIDYTHITKGRRGFTLVELMVVVAIIGVLSAIALPSFKKYVAKSRTTEAKMSLAEVYTAEQSMFAEFSTYSSCFALFGVSYDQTVNDGQIAVPTRNNALYSLAMSSDNELTDTWGSQFITKNGGPPDCYFHTMGAISPQQIAGLKILPKVTYTDILAGIVVAFNVLATAGYNLTNKTFGAAACGVLKPGVNLTSSDLNAQACITAACADCWGIDQNKKLIQIVVGY